MTFDENGNGLGSYLGWLRMTGSTFDLGEALPYNPVLSVSLGAGGRIVYSNFQAGRLLRIGWAESSAGNAVGELDLSDVDFSQLNYRPALTVEELVVRGNGVIRVNKTAVQNLDATGSATGDDIFDAVAGTNTSTYVISTAQGQDENYYKGKIDVDVVDASPEDAITGFFDKNGMFTGEKFGAALGTWGWGTKFDEKGVYITHELTDLHLLGSGDEALTLQVTAAEEKRLDVGLSGSGDLVKTGSGTLNLASEADWSGVARVKEGTLSAVVGALGLEGKQHAALEVAENGEFRLTGARDGDQTQRVKSLTSSGLVTIDPEASSNELVLSLDQGGTLHAGAQLSGDENAVLEVAGGTLVVTDLENADDGYAGTYRLKDGSTLALTGSDTKDAVDLSKVKGTGTISVADSALYDTTGEFAGTTKVTAGGELQLTSKSKVNSQAALAADGGSILSEGNHTFDTITLENATIDLGSALAGSDYASGALTAAGDLTLKNVTLKAVAGLDSKGVNASELLTLDDVGGKTTWLLTGKNVKLEGDITIDGVTEGSTSSAKLMQGGDEIGTVHASLKTETDNSRGVGFTTRATAIELKAGKELVLDGNADSSLDSTLDLEVRKSEQGGIRIASNTVTLAGDGKNSYGTLSVDEGAVARIAHTQTLAQGGTINGRLTAVDSTDAALVVTGGTLTVNETGAGNVAIRLDATDETAGAKLAFSGLNRKNSPIYAGDVSGVSGARVSFADTTGDFRLASGTADYVLSGTSAVTFGPYADEAALKDTFNLQDAQSTAYVDFTKAANAINLSGVTGEGKLALNYVAAGGTLNVAEMNDAFTGTLAFANATATIGTDPSVEKSALTQFATEKGELEVGAGSVLRIDNFKERAEDGSFTPHAVTLAGDLTISDRATLDFTAGVFADHGNGHLGNVSGVSVNAIDMNGNGLVVTDSGDRKLTVRARIDKLDFGTGLPSNGEYHGSILDMLGDTPDYPVLTVIENIRLDDQDVAAIASDMVLEGVGENDKRTVKFWQPNWDPKEEGTVHVANVTTGVKLVGVEDENGRGSIAIGAGITGIDIVSGATLRMDEAASTESTHIVDAEITGSGHVVVTNSLGTAGSDGIVFAAQNGYTGETKVDLGATLTAAHAGAFAKSERVSVGTLTSDGEGGKPETSTLKVSVAQAKTDAYANALKVNALTVGAKGAVELAEGNDILLTGDGTSKLEAGSTLKGGKTTTIGLEKGTLDIVDMSALEGFSGAFRLNDNTTVNLAVTEDYTWKNNVVFYTDARSRAIGAGRIVKNGEGTLHITGSDDLKLTGMNLVAAEGTTHLTSAKLAGLTAASRVTVDGILEVGDLTGEAGNIFELDVVTGKTRPAAEGESTEKDTVWGLGENGSDGIRVTGTASGTLNLAVTPNDLKKGAEESIQLVDAAKAAEGFTVNLVDKAGAKMEALTAGAYDYTLVRKDDAQNGTDVFLSSLTGDDDIRNTTVTAGSYLGVAAAAQLFDISLHDRMSNRSWLTANADGSIANSFWILETVSNERYGDSTGQIDVHDTASTTTVGSDILSGLAAGGTWYAGAMFSYATEDTKSRSNRTALDSRADTDAWAAGFYAGWQLNGADRTGPYVDGWVLWTDAESDVKGGNVSETVDGNGLSASLEAGWGFKALSYNAHGQAGDIYVEPHVSVTWFGYEADDISNDVHDVTFEGKDNIRTKLGVKTYAFGKNSGGFSPFVELNWIHNTETYGATLSGITVDQVGAEDQAEVRAGADWRINDAFSVWGHFGITSGSDGYSNREGSLGVRYRF